MSDIQVFQFNSSDVRIIIDEQSNPWWVAKDVCSLLGYSNHSKTLQDHVDEDDKLNNESLSSLGQRGGWIINESGLYSLILRSNMSQAKAFKRWVTSEVLPSIRKTGSYNPAFTIPQTLPEALRLAADLAEENSKLINAKVALETQIETDKPKILFADSVSLSDTDILIGELAKILRQNGVLVGQNRLFAILREQGYLMPSGLSYNMPSQRSMNSGWLRIIERTVQDSKGKPRIVKTPMVTGKGQQYFINKFLNEQKICAGNLCEVIHL